jgi:hypothetical protein
MSYRNTINGIIITLTLPPLQNADNMNNKLFSPLILIIAITGLSPTIIARIAAFCTP